MKKRMIIVSMLLVLLFSVSSVMAADINLVSPTGGEFLNVESVDIVWTLISGAGTDAVIVEYSDNSGAPLSWNILTSSASAQDLTYPWNTSTIADGCSYRIRLSSTDNSPDEITEDMCLDKLAPVPALDDETIDEGDGVTFDASASTDATAGIQYYMWDIDNDGTEDFSTTVSSLTLTWAQLVSFGIDNNGAFTIGLRVIDYATNDASTTATLTVDNVVPTVTVVSPNGGEELTGTVPVQYTITDPVDVTFTCTFTQTVGGVSTVLGSAACVPGTNTYSWDASTIDSDDVTFTVDADDGDDVGTDTSDAAFLVDNTNPVADADVDQTVDESDVVTYAFGATDGVVGSQFDDQADSFTVNFGDGTALLVTDSLAGITHVYADDGVYTVRLTVTDDVGLTHFDEMDVTVNNVDPVVDAGSDDETNEGTAISLASTFTDVGTADTHTATIDWGDLGVLESVNPATSPITNTHTYVDNGVYIVTVTVTDDDGGFSSDTLTVTVNNVAPTVELLVPPEGDNVNGNVNVTWVISDPSNDTIYNILRYSGDSGATWTTLTSGYHDYVTANGQQHTYMWDTTAVPDGLYNLRVVAQDNDLAENSHNINLTVDNTAPTTQSVESTPADEFASGTEVLFMATLSDNFGVYGGVFKVWDNGVEVLSDATVLPADGVWGDTTEEVLIRLSISLDEDVYQWSIVGTDLAGNTKTFVPGVDVADNFKVTAADASVPDFTLDASQTGAGVSGSILYTVTSITEPLSYVEFEIMPTGEARIFLERVTTLNGDGDYLYTLDTTEYVDGSYRVYATAYDLAGNPKERYKSITVDNAEYYTVEVIDEMITNLNASINANTLLVAGLQTQVDTLSQNVSDNSDAVGVIQTEIVALQLQSSNNAGDIVT
ncbi:PKD domain-containing protein, partial [Candidatus Woesearchaeota archaeon]|nr:PKD domain-containing protein [Candidatus Woesearchaeota archaeon]